MEPPHVILITGISGSGKDTLADYLVERAGYVKLAFADSLKEYCSGLHGIPLRLFYDAKDDPIGSISGNDEPLGSISCRTPRDLCIAEAKLAKETYLQVFADFIVEKIRRLAYYKYVIADYRFAIEYETLKQAFPRYVFTIARVTSTYAAEVMDESDNPANIPHVDITIENDGTYEELYDKARLLLR